MKLNATAEGKVKATLRRGHLVRPVTVEEVQASPDGVTAYFMCEADAARFAAALPKVCAARVHGCTGYDSMLKEFQYGLRWLPVGGGMVTAFGVSLMRLPVDKTTGAVNERGEKRRAAFVKALGEVCEVIDNLGGGK